MRFSNIEIKDLAKAWIAISIAFGIVLSRQLNLINAIIIAGVTVGTGFLFHELGHKFMAQRYRCWAEFRSFDPMLLFAILISFFGFVFAAPGAVMISGYVDMEKNGKISLAGPLVNYILAIIFFVVLQLTGITLAVYGFMINSWIGLFNLIPFGNFDGSKILRWNRYVYFGMVIFGIVLLMVSF